MKYKHIIFLVVLFMLVFSLPAYAVTGNNISAVSISSSTNGTVACNYSGGTWTPVTSLKSDTSYTVTASVDFLDSADGSKGVFYNLDPMSGSSGNYSKTVSKASLAAGAVLSVVSGSQANTYSVNLTVDLLASDADLNKVRFTLAPSDASATQYIDVPVSAFTSGSINTAVVLMPNKAGIISVAVTPSSGTATVNEYIPNFINPALGYPATVNFSITSEDGLSTKSYRITVERQTTLWTDATLSSLVIAKSGGATLGAWSNPSTSAYTIANAGDSINITPTRNDPNATYVIYRGNTVVATNTPATNVTLTPGVRNSITIVATAENGTSVRTYTVYVYTAGAISSDAYLSELLVSTNSSSTSSSYLVNMYPAFDPETTLSYSSSVANSVSSISIKALTQERDATIKINGDVVDSGDWSGYINLSVGSNSIPVLVTSADGSKHTYYNMIITRAAVSSEVIKLTIGSRTAVVNNQLLTMDTAPFLYTYHSYGYTMVPIRFIAEQLGATVDWNNYTKTVTISLNNKILTMKLGQANAAVGLIVPPIARNNRIFIPLRYVSEQLGATVDWNNTMKSIIIMNY